jgi:hypothetical protein
MFEETSRLLPAGLAPLTAATGPAAIRASGHGLRLVHAEAPATDLVPVELGDGFPCALGVTHLDEREPARLAGRSIANDGHGAHLTSGLEEGL